MFANERRLKITELLTISSSITVSELIQLFQVSIETIRRDLEYLERQGALKRVHGGAVSVQKMQNYTRLSERVSDHQAEKHELAELAAGYVEQGDIIAVDAGSTTPIFAHELTNMFSNLTVITNSLDIFHICSNKKGFEVILTGGYYHENERAFYGHLTLDMINQLHISKYFLSPSALSLSFGISDFIKEIIPVQRAFLLQSRQVFVLADSSKFETSAALRICKMEPSYIYVTDSALPQEIRQRYEEHHILLT